MIKPAPRPQKISLSPGELYTGQREYACDGGVFQVQVEGTVDEPRVSSCQVLELHDLNVGQRRTRHDVGGFLRRCLQRIRSDGLIVVREPQVLMIPAERISVEKVRFQQYCSASQASGPFTSEDQLL